MSIVRTFDKQSNSYFCSGPLGIFIRMPCSSNKISDQSDNKPSSFKVNRKTDVFTSTFQQLPFHTFTLCTFNINQLHFLLFLLLISPSYTHAQLFWSIKYKASNFSVCCVSNIFFTQNPLISSQVVGGKQKQAKFIRFFFIIIWNIQHAFKT